MEALDSLAKAMNADDEDRPPSERDPDLDELYDIANLERFSFYVASGGMERGFTWDEIKLLDPIDRHDYSALLRLYGPLTRQYRKAKEARDKRKRKDEQETSRWRR